MAIEVFVANEQVREPVDCASFSRLAEGVLVAEGVRGNAELSVLFVDEETISALNERFLGKKGPTDVLSFPIEDAERPTGRAPDGGGNGPGWEPEDSSDPLYLVGDVVVCPAVAAHNAPEHAGTYEEELALLVVHGVLHLLGMDHEKDDEAEVMEAREQELLDDLYRNK